MYDEKGYQVMLRRMPWAFRVMEKAVRWMKNKMKNYFNHSRMCPNCQVWTHEVMGCSAMRTSEDDSYVDIMTCIQCGYESKWFCGGMMPMLHESEGVKKKAEAPDA